jgi:hypothetical protein
MKGFAVIVLVSVVIGASACTLDVMVRENSFMPVNGKIEFRYEMTSENLVIRCTNTPVSASEDLHHVVDPRGVSRLGVFAVPREGCLFYKGRDLGESRLFLSPRHSNEVFNFEGAMPVYVNLVIDHDVARSDIREAEPITLENLGVARASNWALSD